MKRVGMVYTTGPGEWQRAFPLEVPLRGAVEMRGWTREGMRVWLRGQMKWEAGEEFVEWMYGETGGVPGYVREGVKYLIGRGVLEREGEGWELRRDYRGVALGESLGVMGEGGGHNLPVELTGFVGREREIEEVRRMLEEGRLVTVVGSGGSGKTRLGVQVGREGLGGYRDGVWFVGLAGLERGDQIVTALGEAMKFNFYGQREAREQLLDYVREKEMLLIFDNFEHVMEGVGIVQDALEAAPGVKVLATSRERLRVEGEAVLELGGMGYPEEGKAEKAEEYSAVQLFVQSARRAKTGFRLAKGERGDVARICRLVRGMPLGIELAAAWVTSHSCQDIVKEIERSLDFVAAQEKDRPERHLSLRAVFEYSWELLSDRERDALVRLSIFRGGFRREAAEKAAGVSLLAIAALVDKSLVQRHASGRYEIHEVLRHYAEERRAGRDQAMAIGDEHCKYFADFLHTRTETIKSARQQDTLTQISEEIENIRAGWRWIIDHRRLAELDRSLTSLAVFYELRNWFREGEEVLGRAAQMLEGMLGQGDGEGSSIELLYGKVLSRYGKMQFRLSQYDVATEFLRKSLSLLQKQDAKEELGMCYFNLGVVAQLQGRYADAKRELETGLRFAQDIGDAGQAARCLGWMGIVDTSLGEFKEAYRLLQKSLEANRAIGDPWGIANSLNNLGLVADILGQVTEARGLYRESMAICKQLGDRYGMANSLNNLGYLAQAQGEKAQAKRFYQESLALYREIGNRWGVANVLTNLGGASLALGEVEEAERHYHQGLKAALEVQALPIAMEALVGIATLLTRRGYHERAVELLGFAEAQDVTDKETKDRCSHLLTELESKVASETFAAARDSAATLRLESVIAQVLGESNPLDHARS